ncbi:hypothetical protein [Exiguobacterium undae]
MINSPTFVGEPVRDNILDGVAPLQMDWRELPLGKGGGIPVDDKKDNLIAVRAKVLMKFEFFNFVVDVVTAYNEFPNHEISARDIYCDLSVEASEAFGSQLLGALLMTTSGSELYREMEYDETTQTVRLPKIQITFDEVKHARYRFI